MGPLPQPPKPKKDTAACGYQDDCPSPPSSGAHHRRLVTALVSTASVLVFLALVSLSIYCFVRRRRRRRQQSLLAAEAANPNPGVEGGGAGAVLAAPEPGAVGGGAEEEVGHHAWHIRTVGLDEAAIESIALTQYRAGAGMLGAADCSVCLGEFQDGELLRLLPNCGHAFHVPCIDTWLRAHVNCPLCRSQVLDHAATGDADPPASADAGTVAAQAPSNTETSELEHGQPGPGQQQSEQRELRVQIDHRDHAGSPEPPHRHHGSRLQSFQRAASMEDSSLALAVEAPEDEQSNYKAEQGNGGDGDAARCKGPPRSGRPHHMERSLSGGGGGGGRWSLTSSRHCRTRSSGLPL